MLGLLPALRVRLNCGPLRSLRLPVINVEHRRPFQRCSSQRPNHLLLHHVNYQIKHPLASTLRHPNQRSQTHQPRSHRTLPHPHRRQHRSQTAQPLPRQLQPIHLPRINQNPPRQLRPLPPHRPGQLQTHLPTHLRLRTHPHHPHHPHPHLTTT